MAREKGLARRERAEMEQYEPWNTFREMERMFRNFFTAPFLRTPRWMTEFETDIIPEVDIRETEKELVLSASLPGLEKDDIDIDVTEDSVTVSGERKREEKPEGTYHLRQQTYGSFKFSYSLPVDVKPDDVKAVYRNGILEVTMPKAQVREAHKVKVDVKS